MTRDAIIQFIKKCKVAKNISKDMTICVSRAATYDLEQDKKFWKLEGNRSEVRDVNCSDCGHQVVMSNNVYRDYIANERENRVLCMDCTFKEFNKKTA